ncbi:MAG: right-handed parallel beta-helix repeat-containing protein [Nitrospirales bacterium]|nr:right-handed parallel beta-helix repeat-containing protein [Nitrospirales bacterium]
MLCLVCVLVVSINPLGAFAAEFFVSTTGNNSNSGTIQSPFLTLEKAASVMAAGDTMYIRAGTYKRRAGDLAVPSGGGSWATATTIKAYNNEEVIITPFDETSYVGTRTLNFASNRSWIIVDGLIIDGLNQSGGKGGAGGIVLSYNGHHFRIINTEIRYTAASGLGTSNATHNEFINLHLHHNNHQLPPGDPNYSKRNYGIYLESGNNLVQGCDIHHNRDYGIHMYSGQTWKPNNNIIVGNTVYENGRTGILVWSGVDSLVANNVVWGNGTGASTGYTGDNRHGIYTNSGAHNTLLYNNTLYGNVEGELFLGGGADRIIAKNNIMYGNGPGYALRLDSGQTGTVVSNNAIYHTTTARCILNNAGAGATVENSNIVGQNPFFIDEKNANFHLQSGSPAIGKGSVLNEVKVDFNNVQRNQPNDLGAYAFVSSSLSDTTRPAPPRDVTVY